MTDRVARDAAYRSSGRQHSKNLVLGPSISERSGLPLRIVEGLLVAGWRYSERIDSPHRWEYPTPVTDRSTMMPDFSPETPAGEVDAASDGEASVGPQSRNTPHGIGAGRPDTDTAASPAGPNDVTGQGGNEQREQLEAELLRRWPCWSENFVTEIAEAALRVVASWESSPARPDLDEWEYGWEADESIRSTMNPRGPKIMLDGYPGTPESLASFPKGRRIRRRKAGPWETVDTTLFTCLACTALAVDSGDGRFCPACEDHEGTCENDHCLTCGSAT